MFRKRKSFHRGASVCVNECSQVPGLLSETGTSGGCRGESQHTRIAQIFPQITLVPIGSPRVEEKRLLCFHLRRDYYDCWLPGVFPSLLEFRRLRPSRPSPSFSQRPALRRDAITTPAPSNSVPLHCPCLSVLSPSFLPRPLPRPCQPPAVAFMQPFDPDEDDAAIVSSTRVLYLAQKFAKYYTSQVLHRF